MQRFFKTGSTAAIQPAQAARLRLILTGLHPAATLQDVALPRLQLHALHGDRQGWHAVSVSGNWRVVFRWLEEEVSDVDLIDYQ